MNDEFRRVLERLAIGFAQGLIDAATGASFGDLSVLTTSLDIAPPSRAFATPSTLKDRVESFLEEHPGEYTVASLFTRLGLPKQCHGSLYVALSILATSGRIQRVRPGVYASLGTDLANVTRIAPSTFMGRLVSFLEEHPGEHTVATLVPSLGLPENRRSSLHGTLGVLAKSGRIQRMRPGVFAAIRTSLSPMLHTHAGRP